MKKLRVLAALSVGLVAGTLIAPGTIAATMVAAPTPIPGVPSPLNILPSVVGAAKGTVTWADSMGMLTQWFAKDARFWNYVKSVQAGTATAAETAAVNLSKLNFKVPAVAPGLLMKTVAGASWAGLGLQMGVGVGNGAVRLLGFKDEMVCAQNNGIMTTVAALTNGVDCNAWQMTQDAITNANNDAVAGLIGQVICDPADASRCLQFLGFGNMDSNGQQRGTCFKLDGPNTGTNLFMRVNDNPGQPYYLGGESFSQMKSYFTRGNCNAIPGANGDRLLYDWPGVLVQNITAYTFDPTYVGGDTIEVGTADPERFLRCTLRLVGGDTVAALSDGFHESDGAYAPIVCPELPDGGVLEGWEIDLIGGPDELRLLEEDVTPEYGDWSTTYPECADGTCMLDLQKSSVSCFTAPSTCADWFADPSKESTYQCRYGEHDVPLAECNVYSPTFKPDATTTGVTYGDPDTGAGYSSPTTRPADVTGFASPVQDPATDRVCFPQGWAVLNPVEWVMKPVQCALEWAFVPRQSVVIAQGTRVVTAWDETAVGEAVRLVQRVPAMVPDTASDCRGPALTFSGLQNFGITDSAFYPLSSCDEPLATIAFVGKIALSTVLGILALLAVIRFLSGVISFPGLGAKE